METVLSVNKGLKSTGLLFMQRYTHVIYIYTYMHVYVIIHNVLMASKSKVPERKTAKAHL